MADPVSVTLVLLILAGAIWLFVTERFPLDLVALMVLGTLLLVGLVGRAFGVLDDAHWVTPEEGISGFSNAAVITVAAMFVLSAGLQHTGAVRSLGLGLARVDQHPSLLLGAVMLIAIFVSAFSNNTATVAILMPLTLAVAARRGISPSLLLIPLSYAAQFGGTCTLIGSSTNILVSSIAARAGVGEFHMFELGQMGWILCVAGFAYLIAFGRFLLPVRRGAEVPDDFQLGEYSADLHVAHGSALAGAILPTANLSERFHVHVLEVSRAGVAIDLLTTPIAAGDTLIVRGRVQDLMGLRTSYALRIRPELESGWDRSADAHRTLAEAVVAPRSQVHGRRLSELDLRDRLDIDVLGVQRSGQAIATDLGSVRLRFGDGVLLLARPEDVARLRAEPDWIVLQNVREPSLRRHKLPLVLGLLAGVVGLAAVGLMPIVVSAILGCIALVATRCISMQEAYEAIDWKVIFLLAGVLPLGIALEKSGAAGLLANLTLDLVGDLGPLALLAALYVMTAVLTEFMSNNATAVLLAPLAISLAQQLEVSPKPFLMAVLFAASTAFTTPVGYQTNAMIYGPGGYRFSDYARIGIPLNLLFAALCVYFIPKYWPFT